MMGVSPINSAKNGGIFRPSNEPTA